MSCFEEGAEPLVVDFHENEPPGCQKKTLEVFWWLEFLDCVVLGKDGMVTDKKESTHLVSPRV